MPKHYKDMMDELINKIDEDAPTNAVGDGGNVLAYSISDTNCLFFS